jgi:hypothetical protein
MKSLQKEIANKEIGETAGQLKELSGLNGTDLIVLFVSARYTQRLLNNARVRRYLKKRWPEILKELEDTGRSSLDSESFRLQ